MTFVADPGDRAELVFVVVCIGPWQEELISDPPPLWRRIEIEMIRSPFQLRDGGSMRRLARRDHLHDPTRDQSATQFEGILTPVPFSARSEKKLSPYFGAHRRGDRADLKQSVFGNNERPNS